MTNQEQIFRYRRSFRFIIFIGAPFFIFMGVLSYFSLGNDRDFYLWFFSVASILYLAFGWYYHCFRMNLSDKGIRLAPLRRSFWVKWEDINEVRIYGITQICFKLKNSRQKKISLQQFEKHEEILQLVNEHVSIDKIKRELSGSLFHSVPLNRSLPLLVVCFAILCIGLYFGHNKTIMVGILAGIAASMVYAYEWYQEARANKIHKYTVGIVWNLLFWPAFFTGKEKPFVEFLLVLLFMISGFLFCRSITALIMGRILKRMSHESNITSIKI